MSDAPVLSAEDIKAELRTIHAVPHTLSTTALYGRGEADEVTVPLAEPGRALRFRVVPVDCELAFYEALAAGPVRPPRPARTWPEDGEEALVLLVDYATELPEDLCARLAGRRLFFPDPSRRLGRKFAASAAGADLLRDTAVCRAILEDPVESLAPTPGTTVSLAHALRALLLLHAGYPMDWALSLERLVEFAARCDRYPGFAAYLQRRPEVGAALDGFLRRSLGPLGPVVLRAWVQGLGRRVAALLFLLEGAGTTLPSQPFLRAALVQALRGVDGELDKVVLGDGGTGGGLLPRVQEVARTLHLVLNDREAGAGEAQWQREPPRRALDAVLAEAERLVPDRDEEAVVGLLGSVYLPQALRRTRVALAQALDGFLERPTQASFAAAAALLERLAQHRQVERGQVEPVEMVLRLCGYLLERPDFAGAAEVGAPYEEFVLLAQHYAEVGGFVDHARRVARGRTRSEDALEAAVARVVARVDARRDEDDERFARGLSAWLDARRPDGEVWPIEQVLERVAVPFLEKSKRRKLLVLVLDGMAWHSAVELLLDLEQRERGAFAPLRYRPPRAGAWGAWPPVLAGLPTITSVSRAALLGGRTPRAGDAENTSLDKARFAEHAGLYKATGETPLLLLRGELEAESGTIRQEALDVLGSARRVVGVVVNAIDDQLHGSRQVRVRYGLETIKMLPDLLQAAAAAERAVLVVADHGHVSGARLGYVGRRGTGGRWRELAEGEAPQVGEIALGQEGVWRPRRTGRVALLHRETETFRTAVGEGEHGGACLAEVVAPALLLGAGDLAGRHGGDAELETVAWPRPGWWELAPRERTARVKVARAKPEASPQLALLPELVARAQAVEEEVTVAPPPSEWRVLLQGSKALKGAPRATLGRIILGVEGLAEHGGRLGVDQFARRVELPPGRAVGFVSEMGEWLNQADEEVVWLDRQSRQVVLKLDVLKSLFGEG